MSACLGKRGKKIYACIKSSSKEVFILNVYEIKALVWSLWRSNEKFVISIFEISIQIKSKAWLKTSILHIRFKSSQSAAIGNKI